MPDVDLNTTAELIDTIRTIRTPRRFFMDRYFRATPFLSTRGDIVFEEVLQDLPVMAPFVSPVVEAKPQRRNGSRAKSFTPAYLKPKHTVMPSEGERRRPGEEIYGSADPSTRFDAARLEILELQKKQCEERWEWLAARAVVYGKVIIESEDYPAVEVDFGRSADNDILISGAGSVWSNPSADIAGQLEDWSDQILELTGYAGRDVVMSPEAWRDARKNEQFLKELDIRRGAVDGGASIQPLAGVEGVRSVGAWGEFNLYTYAGRFKEQDGTLSRAIEETDVIMVAPPSEVDGMGGVHGIPAFGYIQDPQNMEPTDIFTKSWMPEDPPAEVIMSQSAPLMIPGRPNAVIRATVRSA